MELREHKSIYSGCYPDCPRCAQDELIAIINRKRDVLSEINQRGSAYDCVSEIALLDWLLKEVGV